MSRKVYSGAVVGLDAELVTVEACRSPGLRNVTIVGLGDAAVKEARERVQAALKFSDLEFPRGRVSVNLAPADIKKQGTIYDLPIALAVLGTVEAYPADALKGLVAGELGLDGTVRPVPCILLLALCAKANQIAELFVPKENASEAALVSGLIIYPVESLTQIIRHLRNEEKIPSLVVDRKAMHRTQSSSHDMAHVAGQESVKRALEISAAGSHNILLYGPPGTGKTLLARTMPTILPPLNEDEAIEVTKIHSVAGVLPFGTALMHERPFRCPHHTSSSPALVGGGTNPRPGEISLAHRGVLFLDEFPEFGRATLEAMRQPLEDGVVTVSRALATIRYPAEFMLVAAMNPCPCGFATDPTVRCVCTPFQLVQYRKKVSGPLLDRIDLMVDVPKISFEKLHVEHGGEASSVIRERVLAARERQHARLTSLGLSLNRQMTGPLIKQFCVMNDEAAHFLKSAMERMSLSARAYTRILKVARTIADLADVEQVTSSHVAEAIQFRPKLGAL